MYLLRVDILALYCSTVIVDFCGGQRPLVTHCKLLQQPGRSTAIVDHQYLRSKCHLFQTAQKHPDLSGFFKYKDTEQTSLEKWLSK